MAEISKYLNWPKLILASGSPRRRQLLAALGADFTVVVPRISESVNSGDDPARTARILAKDKAVWVSQSHHADRGRRIIVAADTLVALRRQVLGKPADAADAARMLSLLSEKWHTVVTGICLLDRMTGKTAAGTETTNVKFRKLSGRFIRDYVASGEPLDKAGAYGIQELGALLVERIQGCYFNVVGLPLARLAKMLERFI
ncbi:MAG: Maf family protein [Candidatus Edwardsbacteria bacterium]|nr:Maf family protein [Candidatus Edwardsbacteria bacterium]